MVKEYAASSLKWNAAPELHVRGDMLREFRNKTKNRNSSPNRQSNDGLYYLVEGESIEILGIDPASTKRNYIIPEKIAGVVVRTITANAFEGNSTIESIEFPESITSIGSSCLEGCQNLRSVTLPTTLSVIEPRTFADCNQLEKALLPAELQSIGEYAFSGCTALTRFQYGVWLTGHQESSSAKRDVEDGLPCGLSLIGDGAFRKCEGLQKVVVPIGVSRIPRFAFNGCQALGTVWLHNELQAIEDCAFSDCPSLHYVRIPSSLTELGSTPFDPDVLLLCEEGSTSARLIAQVSQCYRVIRDGSEDWSSRCGASGKSAVRELLDNSELRREYLEYLQIRPATDQVSHGGVSREVPQANASRFMYDEVSDIYRAVSDNSEADTAVTIAFAGDVLFSSRLQNQTTEPGSIACSGSFEHTREWLSEADLAVANMHNVFAPSFPYQFDRPSVDGLPNLNAPPEILSAVRNGGFDMVANADNHVCCVGAGGVLETLDSLNRSNLIHSGIRSGSRDKAYVLFNINGIQFACASFTDQALLSAQRAILSKSGLEGIVSPIREKWVAAEIAEAKSEGASFVIAFCHWGSEHADQPSDIQREQARMVANAGADYIIGSHPQSLQPYSVVRTIDGRRVPVIYSAGTYLPEDQLGGQDLRDSLLGYLKIASDANGNVELVADGYVSRTTIETVDHQATLSAAPGADQKKGDTGCDAFTVEEAENRIARLTGSQYRQIRQLAELDDGPVPDRKSWNTYVARNQMRIEHDLSTGEERVRGLSRNKYKRRQDESIWLRDRRSAEREAVIMCAGALFYDGVLERNARLDDTYQFRSSFRHVRAAFAEADLAIGAPSSVSASEYLPLGSVSGSSGSNQFPVARPEFLDAVSYAGFDCIAMANPFNLDLGVSGLRSTIEIASDNGLVVSGIGSEKEPIFDVNGIKVAVLSSTLELHDPEFSTTDEGFDLLLNKFSPSKVKSESIAARRLGADFILGYLDCRSLDRKYTAEQRLGAAKQMAESGADYVICNRPGIISRYETHRTADGRIVPIATGLGTLVSGKNPDNARAAIMRLVLRRKLDGSLELDDSFIPVKRFTHYMGAVTAPVPVNQYYVSGRLSTDFRAITSRLQDALGSQVAVDSRRKVTVDSHYQPQISPREIKDALGAEFTQRDRALLGLEIDLPVRRVVATAKALTKNCAAVLAPMRNGRPFVGHITAAQAKEKNVKLAIATSPVDGIPTIVVDDPWEAYISVIQSIRQKYTPLTVAVTGTAGKTTTKDMIASVFSRGYRTLAVAGNGNTTLRASQSVQKLSTTDEAFVQEVHEGSPGSAARISSLIYPDIAVITSIGDAHLAQLGSEEALLDASLDVTKHMRPNGTLIVNHDSERLRDIDTPFKILEYSTYDSSCDYYAEQIGEDESGQSFIAVTPSGRYNVVLRVHGRHNVSNALGAFAAAETGGVPVHKIIAGLSTFETTKMRQNLVHVAGYSLYVDAYNSNPLSLASALETVAKLPVAKGGRRIAVLGDMAEQGSKSAENHVEAGKQVASLPFDILFTSGTVSRKMAETAEELGTEAHHFDSTSELNWALSTVMRPGDLIMFKASGSAEFTERVVYPLFGKIV